MKKSVLVLKQSDSPLSMNIGSGGPTTQLNVPLGQKKVPFRNLTAGGKLG